MTSKAKLALAMGVGVAFAFGATTAAQATKVKRGGVLNLVVGSKIPSFDGHKESTFGMIHPIRPFYSLSMRVDPNNPQSPTAFQCDVCEGAIPTPTNDGKRYTFKIKKNVTFHDGQKMTAHDVVATHKRLSFRARASPRSVKVSLAWLKRSARRTTTQSYST